MVGYILELQQCYTSYYLKHRKKRYSNSRNHHRITKQRI